MQGLTPEQIQMALAPAADRLAAPTLTEQQLYAPLKKKGKLPMPWLEPQPVQQGYFAEPGNEEFLFNLLSALGEVSNRGVGAK